MIQLTRVAEHKCREKNTVESKAFISGGGVVQSALDGHCRRRMFSFCFAANHRYNPGRHIGWDDFSVIYLSIAEGIFVIESLDEIF